VSDLDKLRARYAARRALCGAPIRRPQVVASIVPPPPPAPVERPACTLAWCTRPAIRAGETCAHHADLARTDPTEREVTLLVEWGWRVTFDGWWRDPSSGGRRHWREALACVRRDLIRGDQP
jgi:hypothetical protein